MTEAADFWSRRKAAVAAEVEAERVAVLVEQEDAERATLEERSDSEVLEELGLKDPDSLEAGDDFAAFLQKSVPERIRRRALRRLWRADPTLANLDGLIDYGEDYTDAATVVENLQTAYQVGKGMLKHVLASAEADAEADSSQGDLSVTPPPEDDTVALAEPERAEAEVADLPEDDTGQGEEQQRNAPEALDHFTDLQENGEPVLPARRRMRFEFAS